MAERYRTLMRFGDELRFQRQSVGMPDTEAPVDSYEPVGQRAPDEPLLLRLSRDQARVRGRLRLDGERSPSEQLERFAQYAPPHLKPRLRDALSQHLLAAAAILNKREQADALQRRFLNAGQTVPSDFVQRCLDPVLAELGRQVATSVSELGPDTGLEIAAGPLTNGSLDDRPLLFSFRASADGRLELILFDPGQISAPDSGLPLDRSQRVNVRRMRRTLAGLASCRTYLGLIEDHVMRAEPGELATLACRFFGDDAPLRFTNIRVAHRFRLATDADIASAMKTVFTATHCVGDIEAARKLTCE